MARLAARKVETVITATLVRGLCYVYKKQFYRTGQPKVVDEALADELEELADDVHDADGEIIEKPLFDIDWEAQPPEHDETDLV